MRDLFGCIHLGICWVWPPPRIPVVNEGSKKFGNPRAWTCMKIVVVTSQHPGGSHPGYIYIYIYVFIWKKGKTQIFPRVASACFWLQACAIKDDWMMSWSHGCKSPKSHFNGTDGFHLGVISMFQKKKVGERSGQISIIPKPELRGFWGSSLIKPPFRVTSADVVIICPERCHLPNELSWGGVCPNVEKCLPLTPKIAARIVRGSVIQAWRVFCSWIAEEWIGWLLVWNVDESVVLGRWVHSLQVLIQKNIARSWWAWDWNPLSFVAGRHKFNPHNSSLQDGKKTNIGRWSLVEFGEV